MQCDCFLCSAFCLCLVLRIVLVCLVSRIVLVCLVSRIVFSCVIHGVNVSCSVLVCLVPWKRYFLSVFDQVFNLYVPGYRSCEK